MDKQEDFSLPGATAKHVGRYWLLDRAELYLSRGKKMAARHPSLQKDSGETKTTSMCGSEKVGWHEPVTSVRRQRP
ncbi:hypothetical protein [Acidiphilium iwatense]|uniref:hypothetical protein n=1 Tax=Acidiphilium iwatense TaxID=768198 RepID=UPI001F25A9DF|nr:hypothetical protein [Acidiphilium iwatense]